MKRLALLALVLTACGPDINAPVPVIVAAPLVTTTTTAPPTTTTRVIRPRADRDGPRTPVTRPVLVGDIWTALGRCESHNNPRAVSRNGLWRGAFQQSAGSWARYGNGGPILEQSYEEQLAAAKRQQAAEGWRPWPACSRRIGVR